MGKTAREHVGRLVPRRPDQNRPRQTEFCSQFPLLLLWSPHLRSHRWVLGKCGYYDKRYLQESRAHVSNRVYHQSDVHQLTLALNSATSSSVRVSALAITGIRLTLVCSRRMNSISRGFRLRDAFVTDMYATSMKIYSRVTRRLDEVQTGMDTIVHEFLPVDAVFLFKIRVETGFNVLDDWFPARMKDVT